MEVSPLKNKQRDLSMLWDLRTYIYPHKGKLFIAAVFLLAATGLDLIRPFLLKQTIDTAFPDKNMGLILQLTALYMGTIVLEFITTLGQNFLLKKFGQTIIFEVRNDVFKNIICRSKKNFDTLPVGNLVTRITNDTEALRSLFTDVLLKMISSVVILIGIVCFMYFLSPPLTLLTICIIPIMGVIIYVYRIFARKAFRALRSKVAESNANVQEMLNFIVIVKTYLGQTYVGTLYDRVSREYLAAGLQEVKTFAIFRPIIDGLYFLVIISILAFTNWIDTALDAGTVFAALQYVQKIFQPLKDIAEKYTELQQSLAGAERLLPILSEKKAVTLADIEIPSELYPIRSIQFDHVWFSYDTDEQKLAKDTPTTYALKDINFTVSGGEYIGIVGPSGGGKSTLMSLLTAIHTPTKGAIYINGNNIAKYSPQIIRELIGYVFQDSHLFKGSIRENLSLYEPETSDDAIITATKKAHLHDMIERLPEGYQTPVGYLGSLLSTGQQQLLALARTLVKEKPILVFDEATAHIDSETERLIQESIEVERGEKTIFSIAHRLSSIRGADLILCIQQGEIIERGTFDELLNQKGLLYSLWSKTNEIY